MKETAFAGFALMLIVFVAGVFGNSAFAKTTPDNKIPTKEKPNNAKALADETRIKAMEKSLKESTAKKTDSKKQLALEAKASQDKKKSLALPSQKNSLKLVAYRLP